MAKRRQQPNPAQVVTQTVPRDLMARYVNLIGYRGEETPQSQAMLDANDDKVFHVMAAHARHLKFWFSHVCPP
jgi:hypothetical protein